MAVLDEVLQTLEIQPTGIPTVVRLSQNENGRQIRLTLRGNEDDFPAGCLVTIAGTKPDGVVYSAEGELDGNIAVINEDTQMTAVAGMWKARVQVTYGGSTIATELIVFEVYADPVDPDSVPSESEITGLVAQAQYWAENAKSSAYGSPLTANTAAEMTETDRVYVYTGSESGYSNGHWYYYDGTSWQDGGIYNAAAVQTDTTLSVSGMAADAKAAGDAIATEADRVDTLLEGKADTNGTYPDLTAGTASALLSDSYTEDTAPYKYRRTPYASKRLSDEIVGGSVVFNQLVQNGDFSDGTTGWTNNGNRTMTVADGAITVDIVDTTAHYGLLRPGVRDLLTGGHLYIVFAEVKPSFALSGFGVRLGNNTTKSTVTLTENVWNHYGAICLVDDTVTYGFALWAGAERLQVGTIATRNVMVIDLTQMFVTAIADYLYNLEQTTAGAGVALFRKLFPKDFYEYDPGTLKSVEGLSAHVTTGFNQWDEEWEVGGYTASGNKSNATDRIRSANKIRVLPNTAYYVKFPTGTAMNFIAEYGADEAFIRATYLSASGVLNIPSDCYYVAFNMNPAYGLTYNNDICINFSDPAQNGTYEPYEKHTYALDSTLTLRGVPKLINNAIAFDGDRYASDGTVTRRYGIREYQSGDESLTDAITDGTNTVYALTTPTTETAEPYQAIQICNPDGTEEYVSTTVVPVGHESKYYKDIIAAVEGIPEAPAADGTYTLKVTVTDGAATYSWVSG